MKCNRCHKDIEKKERETMKEARTRHRIKCKDTRMKGENTLSGLYISLLIGVAVIAGFVLFQTNIFGTYGVTSSQLTYLNDTTVQYFFNETVTQTGQIKSATQSVQVTGIAPLDMLISGVWNALLLIFNMGDIYTSFIGVIATALQIPAIFTSIIIAIVMAFILFGIISVIMNRRV